MTLEKTKIMSTESSSTKISIDGREIESVKEIPYLGQLIAFENKMEKEINRRIGLAWKKYWTLRHIFKGNFK